MLQSYAYRLYPNRSQFVALRNLLEIHRSLYNAALEERREAWRKHHISINYSMQARQLKAIREFDPEFAEMNYSACQQTLRRVNKAFQDFFRRIRLGRNSGYPRFKSQSRFNSVAFVFGDGATRNNGRLKIQGVGAIKVKWHRPIPGNTVIKQVVIHRKLDLWYATFQIDLPDETVQPHPGEPIGVDFGLTNLIALSNGELIEAPHFFRQSKQQLRVRQRRASRRKKFSKGWRKAMKQVTKTYAHIGNIRKDHAHKLSRNLANRFSLIAVEDLNVQGLAQTFLARSVFDAGWSQFLAMLDYKVGNTGGRVVRVDPRLTSQLCSACGAIVKKDLNERLHVCPTCGLVLDRDVNAARNILRSALRLDEAKAA